VKPDLEGILFSEDHRWS